VRRVLGRLVTLAALFGASLAPTAAQDERPDAEPSDGIVTSFGYPKLPIEVGPDGIVAPTILPAGFYLVVFSAVEPFVGYLNFMQPPADLGEDEATELALDAAREDLVQEGWVYAGGSSTFAPGVPVKFVIHLAAGEYQIAASYADLAAGVEDVMRLTPLTITAATDETGIVAPVVAARPPSDGTLITARPVAPPPLDDGTSIVAPTPTEPPAASEMEPVSLDPAEPSATVILEETDELRYVVSLDPVPAGPQLWEITNTGEVHAHHVVMARVPEGTVAEDIVDEFEGLLAGTPPALDSVFAQLVFVGYAALQSGGQTTWVELDLEPGTYAVVCFVVDPQTERPHALDGMVTIFTVA
jgi:hypothetical protein